MLIGLEMAQDIDTNFIVFILYPLFYFILYSPVNLVERDDAEKLRQVLSSGISSEYNDQYLSRCLYIAAGAGRLECTRVLLDAGASPDLHTDTNGQTPLVVAVRCGSPDVAAALIAASSNVNKATRVARATALHWAASDGSNGCVRLLLDAGAKLEARMASGRTALMLAARGGHEDVLLHLIKSGMIELL